LPTGATTDPSDWLRATFDVRHSPFWLRALFGLPHRTENAMRSCDPALSLVWDEDQETAVQSSHGGTKVAWGGPPVAPKHGRNRQRFDLTLADGDMAAEVDRLVALGATRLGRTADGTVELADPDGNEFCLAHG